MRRNHTPAPFVWLGHGRGCGFGESAHIDYRWGCRKAGAGGASQGLNPTLSYSAWCQEQALLGMRSVLGLLTHSAGGSSCRRGSGNNLIIRQEILTSSFRGVYGRPRRSLQEAAPLAPTHGSTLLTSAHPATPRTSALLGTEQILLAPAACLLSLIHL